MREMVSGRGAVVLLLWTLLALQVHEARSQEAAQLRIQTDRADSVLVVIDGYESGVRAEATGSYFEVQPGNRQIGIYAPGMTSDTTEVELAAGEKMTYQATLYPFGDSQSEIVPEGGLSEYLRLRTQSNFAVVTGADTRVFLDGEELGRGVQLLSVDPGEHEVRVVDHVGRARTELVRVEEGSFVRKEMMTRPSRDRTWMAAPLPPLAHLVKGERREALLIGGGLLLAVGGYAGLRMLRSNTRSRYDETLFDYKVTESEELALERGDELERLSERMRLYDRASIGTLLFGVALYVWGIYDGMQPPRGGWQPRPVVDWQPAIGTGEIGIGLQVRY